MQIRSSYHVGSVDSIHLTAIKLVYNTSCAAF